jgi:imidazolonepropionase-like amidohydrolase
MNKLRTVLAAGLGLAAAPYALAASLAIQNVQLVDARSPSPIAGKIVFIEDDRITRITDGNEPITADRVIDANGGYLIPGLWDMHVHLQHIEPASLSQFVRYGVTQVRDMGITPEALAALHGVEGSLQPEIFTAGFMLNSARWAQLFAQVYSPEDIAQEMARRIVVATAEQAAGAVERVRDSGATLLKVHFWHDGRDLFRTITEHADQAGLPVAVHDPGPAFDYEFLAEASVASIEHLDGVLTHRLSRISAIERGRQYRRLAEAGVHFTPTLSMIDGLAKMPDGSNAQDRISPLAIHPDGVALDPSLEAFWLSVMKMIPPQAPDWSMFERDLQFLIEARTHGVRILAGTDLGVPGVFPGIGLLTELKLLVEYLKMTPHEVITSATLTPAQWFGIEEVIGTIEPGKRANLVLLEQDPTASIEAIDSIVHVILNGEVVR